MNYNTNTGQLWYLSGSGMGRTYVSQLTQISRGRIMDYYTGNDTDNGTIRSLMLLGAGLSADKAQVFARFFQSSNAAVRDAAVLNNMPTAQIDKIMGNTNKFLTGAKWAGKGVFVASAGISIFQSINALNQGDKDSAIKAGVDFGVGAAAAVIGGIPGVIIYGGYLMIIPQRPVYSGYQPDPYVFPNDNTYVTPYFFHGN